MVQVDHIVQAPAQLQALQPLAPVLIQTQQALPPGVTLELDAAQAVPATACALAPAGWC